MSQPFTEEFLNDFIDGQLSGEELLRAERLLLENAAFREQVETYRAIGRQIKSLPRKSLPADFSQTVVRNLELAPSLSNRAATEIIPSRSNQFWRNGLIAGALAASFLLGVFLIQNQPNVAPDLATAPKSAARHELDSSVEKPVPGAALELQVHDQPNDNETKVRPNRYRCWQTAEAFRASTQSDWQIRAATEVPTEGLRQLKRWKKHQKRKPYRNRLASTLQFHSVLAKSLARHRML
jgi:hypothetical protein